MEGEFENQIQRDGAFTTLKIWALRGKSEGEFEAGVFFINDPEAWAEQVG